MKKATAIILARQLLQRRWAAASQVSQVESDHAAPPLPASNEQKQKRNGDKCCN